MYKHLLASGCSFTFDSWNWPTFVAQDLNIELSNVGMGSMGNTLIARRAITKLNELLEVYNPEDILVGIMWSGENRYHRFVGDTPIETHNQRLIGNPTYMWPNGEKVWEISNNHWDTEFNKNYLKYIHTFEDSFMSTIDSIILTQNYFKSLGVDYFMCSFIELFKYIYSAHSDVKKYSKLIDYSKFADIGGCFEWCRDNQINFEYTGEFEDKEWVHPLEEGHKAFAKNVILPFITKNKTNNSTI